MYTEQIRRRKSNAYYEMKTISSTDEKGKLIEKLGSSIYTSMDSLQSLKSKIMVASINEIKPLILAFRKEHASFLEKQKNLFELDEDSEKMGRLRAKVKEFLETFTPDDIERKLEVLKDQCIRESSIKQGLQQTQMMNPNMESLQAGLLREEDQEIKMIQRLMHDVKKIAIDTSSLIVGVGAKIKLAETSMKEARIKMQMANKQLVETNKYEQSTTKTKILFCVLISVVVLVLVLIMVAAKK